MEPEKVNLKFHKVKLSRIRFHFVKFEASEVFSHILHIYFKNLFLEFFHITCYIYSP